MAKDKGTSPDQVLRDTEEAAYHAFREWPVLLVLRQKELAARQIDTPPDKESKSPKKGTEPQKAQKT